MNKVEHESSSLCNMNMGYESINLKLKLKEKMSE